MILLIDSFDSFVFNLDQAIAGLGCATMVVRSDAITPDEIRGLAPDGIVLSPGPGHPQDAPLLLPLLADLDPGVPVLGVCLGHQAIALSEGASLAVDSAPRHGKSDAVHHDGSALFERLPSPMVCGRYHSLLVERDSVPDVLEVSAWTEDGKVMGLRHRELPRFGIQFHPESILTPRGPDVIARFVSLCGEAVFGGPGAGGLR